MAKDSEIPSLHEFAVALVKEAEGLEALSMRISDALIGVPGPVGPMAAPPPSGNGDSIRGAVGHCLALLMAVNQRLAELDEAVAAGRAQPATPMVTGFKRGMD